MPTALSIYKAALGRLGFSWPDGLVGVTNEQGVVSALNAAMDEMSVDHDWLFAYSEADLILSPGVSQYQPPARWLRTSFLVRKDSGEELGVRQRRMHFQLNHQGPPCWYDTSGDQIIIAPVPDTSYTLIHGYFSGFEPIVWDEESYPNIEDQLNETELSIPSPYSTALVLYVARAIAMLATDRQRYDLADDAIQKFNNRLADNRRRQQKPGRIQTRQDI